MRKLTAGLVGVALLLVLTGGTADAVPSPLLPATFIDISTGIGIGSGHVDEYEEIWYFSAVADMLVTLDIDVTAIYPGIGFTDDDSQLFLFDSLGHLLAENDDFPGDGMQSRIENFLIPTTGDYYVGVTTWDNDPNFSGGIITGWDDLGYSSIDYDLIISEGYVIPEPATLSLLAVGLAGLGVLRKRRRRS